MQNKTQSARQTIERNGDESKCLSLLPRRKDAPKKIQLQERLTKRICVNDALTQNLFSLTKGEFKAMLTTGDEGKFLEAKTKSGDISSRYWLDVLRDKHVEISRPLDEFDRDILDACITAEQSGLQGITLRGIWRAITGNTEREFKLSDSMKKEILERADRLACIRLTVDLSDAIEKKFYRAGMFPVARLRGSLLPCEIIETEVNGQIAATIVFTGASPLVRIAKARGGKKKQAAQILTFPTALLDVPGQRNTPLTTAITNYVVRRVEVAKSHTNTARAIRFSTLLARCGLFDADKFKRQDVRKVVEAVMKTLLEKKEIQSFELVKERGEFTKITFNFDASH